MAHEEAPAPSIPEPAVDPQDSELPVWTRRHHSWSDIAILILACDAAVYGAITWAWQVVAAVVTVDLLLGVAARRYSFSLEDRPSRYLVVPFVATLTTELVGHVAFLDDVDLWQHALLFMIFVACQILSASLSVSLGTGIRKRWPRPTLLIGSGRLTTKLASTLVEHPEYGLVPVGIASDVAVPGTTLPVIPLEDAAAEVDRTRATDILISFVPESTESLVPLIRQLQARSLRLAIVPRFFDLSPSRDRLWDIPVHVLPTPLPQNRFRMAASRGMEIVIVTVALVLLSPVMLAAALAVRLTSRGPVLYRQTRVGKEGREFTMYKFRSMRVDADQEAYWTVEDDPRRTKVGRLLRKTGVDELPQLFNVLRGDMSLIGPRPEQAALTDVFEATIPIYRDRERVPAGLTGLAQVSGLRGDTSIEERARFDNRYIDSPSVLLNILILLRTFGAIFRGQ
ncbi:MAG: sugar transferase [Acidimicrobiia bacterium]|nr:sugar transferase [Acidimicrobiia bacterium]